MDFHQIQCDKNEIYSIKKKLEKFVNNFLYTGIEWFPASILKIENNEEKEKIMRFLVNLEDDDDVQNVYSNIKK